MTGRVPWYAKGICFLGLVATGALVGYAVVAPGLTLKVASGVLAALCATFTALFWKYHSSSTRCELPVNPYHQKR